MALNTYRCNCLTPLYFKGLKSTEIDTDCRGTWVVYSYTKLRSVMCSRWIENSSLL